MYKKYGVDSPQKSDIIKAKTKNTCLEKYGVDNPAKAKIVKNKSRKTCLEKYGVEHVLSSKLIQDKGRKTCLEKYGVEKPLQHKQFITKMKQTMIDRYGEDNPQKCKEIHKRTQDTIFKKYGVKYPYQIHGAPSSIAANDYFELLYNDMHEDDQDCTYTAFLDGREFHCYDKEFKRSYFYDFVCTSLKICIEFQGDYWHMNPKKYAPMEWNDVKQMFAIEIWEYDKRKKEYIEEQGYTVSYVWEREVTELQ